MGIYATGQSYEQLILHLIGHPLPEARRYGELILAAIKAVMPSFVSRVERPTAAARGPATWPSGAPPASAGPRGSGSRTPTPATRGRRSRSPTSTATRSSCSRRCCSRPPETSEERTRAAVAALSDAERGALLRDLVGERANRRHRPGRGFEALRYRFEIVSDYGAFRDLQRHRMLTVQWQGLTPDLGAGIPEEVAPPARATPTAPRWTARPPSTTASPAPASPPPRRTRSASATGSATCSTSTRARRCT